MIKNITQILKVGDEIIDSIFGDKAEADEHKAKFKEKVLKGEINLAQLKAKVLATEIASKHWLAANWRPLVMLNFAVLITAHWLGYTPDNLTEAESLKLLSIVQWGIGGYMGLRSAEKIADKVTEARKGPSNP